MSVSKEVDRSPHAEGHELAGFANRTARTKHSDQVTYIITRGSEKEPSRLIAEQLPSGGGAAHRTEYSLAQLEQLTLHEARAINLCVYLLFDAVRRGSILFACAVPTLGDMSVVDDALYIDRISQQAMNAGLAPITFIGADAAHDSLHKGLQRQWSRAEEGWLRIEVAQGRADTEADLLVLVATTYRPLGVLRCARDRIRTRPESKLVGDTAFERPVPYGGMPYSATLCAVTDSRVGVSHEWRHCLRLLVRYGLEFATLDRACSLATGAARARLHRATRIWQTRHRLAGTTRA